ncbi:MAG: polysaccharide biosynthesis/export family protein [Terracidiphilus sp.]
MICRAERVVTSGILLVLLCGCLEGQTSPTGQNDSAQMAPAAASAATATAPAKAHDDRYVIGESDVLGINVWKEQELTRTIPVRSDGKISLPLAGEIQAAGRTPLQLEADITDRLRNYITTPEVTVMVEQINSQKFNVMGQIARPGSYSLTVASTVFDAIAAAGGFRDFAKQKGIYILRQTPSGSETRFNFNYKEFIKGKNPGQNIKLEPHDIIVVP